MRKLAFGAITFGLLAGLVACGGGGDPQLDDDPDAGDVPLACNPVEQTGCADGEKCSWINIDSATDLGTVGCVPDGTVPRDGACMYGADGETTGFDDCVAGQICISGACEPICTISPDSCDSTSSCSRYTGLFTNTTPELGACDYLCDPVTQERLSNPPQPACGGTGTGINATKGCYGVFDGDFSCAGVPQTVAANPAMYDQDATAYGPQAGSAYLNGCAPGFAPLLRSENDMAAPVICMAFCEPGPTCETASANCDPANFNGLPGSGFRCEDRSGGTGTHACNYFWTWETTDTGMPPHPDGVGFCWTPTNYEGDWDGMTGPLPEDTPFPNCNTVAETGDELGQPPSFWGCVPFVAEANGLPPQRAKMPFELATPADIAKRHWREP